MIWPCSGTPSRVTNWHRSPSWSACGIHKRPQFPLRTSFARYVTRPGRRGFSATPLWMRTPEKSSNPLWNGRKRLRNMQNSSLGSYSKIDNVVHTFVMNADPFSPGGQFKAFDDPVGATQVLAI